MRRRFFLSLCLLSAPAVAQMGAIRGTHKVDDLEGGFTGVLDPEDYFGAALATLGDVDGNGVPDLAVAAPRDDDASTNAGAIWITFLDTAGLVVGQQKVSALEGGLTASLGENSFLGYALTGIGDLDGNGVPDVAAMASNPRRLTILRLNADGTVLGDSTIALDAAPFPVGQHLGAFREGTIAFLGDLANDGQPELVLSAPRDDDVDLNSGALWILSIDAAGAPTAVRKISQASPDLGPVLDTDAMLGTLVTVVDSGPGSVRLLAQLGAQFGTFFEDLELDATGTIVGRREFEITLPLVSRPYSLAPVGDLDGDGEPEAFFGFSRDFGTTGLVHLFPVAAPGTKPRRFLAAGSGLNGLDGFAPSGGCLAMARLGDLDGDGTIEFASGSPNDDGGGAFWVLSMVTTSVRNGSGVNPVILSQDVQPNIGSSWTLSLDATGHAPGVAIVTAWSGASEGTFVAAGEVLVDAGSTRFFLGMAAHAGDVATFPIAIPNTTLLVNLQMHVQGLVLGAPGATLGNALGVVIGRP